MLIVIIKMQPIYACVYDACFVRFVAFGSYLIPTVGGYLFESVAFFYLLGNLVAH